MEQVGVALTPCIHRARESLPRGPPSPQRPAPVVRTAGCPAEIPKQVVQAAADPDQPRGRLWQGSVVYIGHMATMKETRVVMGTTTSVLETGGHGPRRKFPPYQFFFLGHGPFFVVEFHHIFFFFSPFSPKRGIINANLIWHF